MKKYQIILVTIMFLGLNACNDFIEEEPQDFLTPSGFYTNDQDAELAINGTYNAVSHLYDGQGRFFFVDTATDIIYSRPTAVGPATEMHRWDINPTTQNLERFWRELYTLINRTNDNILGINENLENLTPDVGNRVLGEALFLRGFAYYNLVILYGEVPLIIEPFTSLDATSSSLAPQQEIWDQVISDLQQARDLLPEKSGPANSFQGRVGRAAANTFLAKSLMYQQRWQEALQEVNAVINSGAYELEESVRDIFLIANENGKESIFESQHSADDPATGASDRTGNIFANQYNARGSSIPGAFSTHFPSNTLLDLFEPQDTRFVELITQPEPQQIDQIPHVGKFLDPTVDRFRFNRNENNFIITRLADVYLMKAEIENELNGGPNAAAIEALNIIRGRANASLYALGGETQAQFREIIFEERAKELFAENHRYHDLKRLGFDVLQQAVESMEPQEIAPTVPASLEFYPIPQLEIDLNDGLD
ncbi:MAG: RagB/SusD family nutrient uptake outer membrane protein [Bacteroidota bacterium]